MCTLVERHDERRPLGRPNHRCNDKIKMDLQERKWKDADWIDFDKVRQKCRDVVEKVTDIFVLWYKINFSADWENVGFLKRTLLYRISWLVRCLVSIFLWLHYFISCDCIILFLVTALLYFSWQHHFIFVTASLYFLWLQHFISCDCSTLFLATALLHFSWLHYFISCMQPYNVIAVTSSVITFNYTFVNLKILVPVFYSASWMAMERMIACWFLEKPINFIFSTTCIVSLCPACPIIPNTYRLYFD